MNLKNRKSEPSNDVFEELEVNGIKIKKGKKVYHARVIPESGICYVQTLKVRTIFDDSFTGVDSVTTTVQFISNNKIGLTVFTNYTEANKVVEEAQKSGKIRKFKEVEKEVE